MVAGFDELNLATLASVHARHADEEVPELLEAAPKDVGLSHYPRGSHAGQEAAVTIMASRVLAGLLSPLDLAVWAHSIIGHDKLPVAERLVELDDVYDTLEYTDMTEQDVNDEILVEARRIVGMSGATAHFA
ncbi:hypothetical protein CSH63_26920 [Micromonospora tulbaghiae]|uniref:Uncharacterized protein n=1 Tax=Micromonospora tulbaghiae TaxID=479978 RepID=A0A386WUX7_9ACTN|nr:hypothetical protein CSH63_26920 [Micromonospora tulbaghiae]